MQGQNYVTTILCHNLLMLVEVGIDGGGISVYRNSQYSHVELLQGTSVHVGMHAYINIGKTICITIVNMFAATKAPHVH